jgi:hypothetical protein
MAEEKYRYASFEAEGSEFAPKFSEYLNSCYSQGWKYKDCQYRSEGGKEYAYCIFKRE